MLEQFLFKLDITAPAITVLLSLVLLAKRKAPLSIPDYLLAAFPLLQLCLNSLAAILQSRLINNLWLYHINGIAVHFLFSYYFLKSGISRMVIRSGFILFCSSALLLEIWGQPYTTFPSYLYALSCFIMLFYGFVYLNSFINSGSTEPILSVKEFWVLAGVFVYFGSSFFIYLSYNYLSFIAPRKVYILWQLHNIFLCFGCFLFLTAVKCKKWVMR